MSQSNTRHATIPNDFVRIFTGSNFYHEGGQLSTGSNFYHEGGQLNTGSKIPTFTKFTSKYVSKLFI